MHFFTEKAPTKSELNSLTHRISQRVAGFLEREGLLVRDIDNDYLALDGLEDDPMSQINGYSITYRITTGKQQGRKFFTLQSIAPMAEQGLGSGCAVILPATGYQKKVGNNNLRQGALLTQNTLPWRHHRWLALSYDLWALGFCYSYSDAGAQTQS